jgi:5-methyltetrahydrofolate--homocysteine methyltransferase
MSKTIREKIREEIVYLDGGTGTVFQSMGLSAGECTEEWNVTHPESVVALHAAYFRSGSDVVNTNTFGVNGLKYNGSRPNYSVDNLVRLAVEHAQKAREECRDLGRELYIALDIGPTGKLLKPLGDLAFEDAVSLFAEIVHAGVKYGVDLISIETMNDSLETKAAVLAAKENSDLPIFVSNIYDKQGKLMTGASPSAMCAMLEGLGVDALGLNCSLGPADMLPIIRELIEVSSVPVIVKPNAGLPEVVDGKTCYTVGAKAFSDEMKQIVEMGVQIVGGCCGTTPEYIQQLYKKTCQITPMPVKDKNRTVVSSYTHAVLFDQKPILIGERINPTGKKKMKEALLTDNMDYLLEEAIKQQEMGAEILDVNVGLPGIDEVARMKQAIFEIQAVTDLPLQIDSGIGEVLDQAMRIYNGKPLVNSVNGKQEVMDTIFPLVRKYGGTVIGLTIDEDGIPDSAEKRVQIAEKIIQEAQKYGIHKKDIVIDPLAMTVSSDHHSALITLEAVRVLHAKGIKTSLGVSNISFGLPGREHLNATFFTMAMQTGLSAAILNPYSSDMMNSYYSFLALSGLDPNCLQYIAYSTATVSSGTQQTGNAAKEIAPASKGALCHSIVKGMKDQAGTLAKELLKTVHPLDLINDQIIPALDIVGKGFEEKTVYLPQLLMSAEAAKSAFEEVKAILPKSKGRFSVILATVKGDIHDIGKRF